MLFNFDLELEVIRFLINSDVDDEKIWEEVLRVAEKEQLTVSEVINAVHQGI